MADPEPDVLAILREVVEPCLRASVRRGELKRGDIRELSLGWIGERAEPDRPDSLVLTMTVDGRAFSFRLATADDARSFDPDAAAVQLDERLQVFVADVIGRPTAQEFR